MSSRTDGKMIGKLSLICAELGHKVEKFYLINYNVYMKFKEELKDVEFVMKLAVGGGAVRRHWYV